MCRMFAVDSGAMTDSIITDTRMPADPNHVPTQPSHDNTREFDGDSRPTGAAAMDENPAVTATKVNGYAEDADDAKSSVAENCNAKNNGISCEDASGPEMVADRAKLPLSSDLRTNGCGGRNVGNSSSAAALLLTNGHVDM